MDSNEALEAFTALRNHFTSSYDYFKYHGKLKYAMKDISTRNDKYQIQKIAKHKDPIGLMVANFAKNPAAIRWAGDMITDEAYTTYTDFLRRRDALTYTFETDLKQLIPLKVSFRIPDNEGTHPLALRLYLGDLVCLETLVIINSLIGFYPYWDKKLADDPVWKSIRLAIPKYEPFLEFDRERFKKIVREFGTLPDGASQ